MLIITCCHKILGTSTEKSFNFLCELCKMDSIICKWLLVEIEDRGNFEKILRGLEGMEKNFAGQSLSVLDCKQDGSNL